VQLSNGEAHLQLQALHHTVLDQQADHHIHHDQHTQQELLHLAEVLHLQVAEVLAVDHEVRAEVVTVVAEVAVVTAAVTAADTIDGGRSGRHR
jgi:uncharacterized membrane protein YcjF (UPF0283 family)